MLEDATSSRSRTSSSAIKPMPAVFENQYVTRINGTNVKKGKTKRDLAEQLRQDIRDFKAKNKLRPRRDRLVRVDRDLHQAGPAARDDRAVREGDGAQRRRDRAVDALRVGRDHGGRAVLQRRAEPLASTRRRCMQLAQRARRADLRQGFQDRPDVDEDRHRAGPQGAHARPRRLVLDEHPRQPRRRGARRSGVVQDEGGVEAVACCTRSCSPRSIPSCTRTSRTSCASTTTRRAATTRKAGTTSTSSGGWAIRCRSRSTSSAATRSSPRRSCSTSRCSRDFAQRAGMKGIQEWLSFYYKSPMAAPGLQPEHDLFIQQTKLKNTLRHLMGEEQITHLGLEYYAVVSARGRRGVVAGRGALALAARGATAVRRAARTLRQWHATSYCSRITSDPIAAARARSTSSTRSSCSDKKTQPADRERRGADLRRRNEDRDEHGRRLREGRRRSARTTAKLDLRRRRATWAIGDPVPPRLHRSRSSDERLDAGRAAPNAPEPGVTLTACATSIAPTSRPADVLAAADAFFPDARPRARRRRRARSRTFTGPLGTLKLSREGRGRALHVRRGRDRPDGREPARPQREAVLRPAAPQPTTRRTRCEAAY